ncbi:MAG: hypothetical protein JWO71_1874 [Candidatus Acidoferrum typicum]|nr:hypothetical protein [Candidatus Acidoferrum typicum]
MSSVLGESMEPFLIMRISSSPLVLFLTLLAMTLILHVVFVWLWPLRDVTLKYVDYVWLSVAAIGAFAASAKGGQFIAANQLNRFHMTFCVATSKVFAP